MMPVAAWINFADQSATRSLAGVVLQASFSGFRQDLMAENDKSQRSHVSYSGTYVLVTY